MTIPNISLGNFLTDVSSAGGNLIKGLSDEREKRRRAALEEALAAAKMAQATRPDFQVRPVMTKDGLVYQRINVATGETAPITDPSGNPASAPEYGFVGQGQDTSGNLSYLNLPRLRPPAGEAPTAGSPIALPPGVEPRREAPVPGVSESPTGPIQTLTDRRKGVVAPTGFQPKADEADERRARDAFEMIQARSELTNIATSKPAAYDEAAAFLSSRSFLDALPILGGPLDQLLSSAESMLSPEAAIYVRAFTQLASARAFSRGGATLTANEIKWALSALSPRLYANPATKAAVDRMLQAVIVGNITGNPAWQRYQQTVQGLGFDPNQSVVPTSPSGRPTMNPRFR